ncbi:hypothetical protein BGZ60DRAFT_566618 [Tricladium varicosporioides]|nr:hypothetical protein BGZ60DRAFT_566618 [Hymenoscyphus varicosporioides]
MPAFKTQLLALLPFPLHRLAAPIYRVRSIESLGPIQPANDEWSSILSGIGPLILLVGDRSTKQVLRNVRGIPDAFSLAAAPLGLLSVVTSLIRFCGIQKFRSFIGYELEARTVPGVEATRVNCGGVHAELSDGYVVRSISMNPMSELVAVSILKGEERELGAVAVKRIRLGEAYEDEKRRKGMPANVAKMEWCLHIIVKNSNQESVDAMVEVLCDAVGISAEERTKLRDTLNLSTGNDENEVDYFTIGKRSTFASYRQLSKDSQESGPSNMSSTFSSIGKDLRVLEKEIASPLTIEEEKQGIPPSPLWDFTFMSTFDAVSEFTTSKKSSRWSSIYIGCVAFATIIMLYLLALWMDNWRVSTGWILLVVGYFGIVLSVLVSAMLISSGCINVSIPSLKHSGWEEGMVASVKNTDSMDVTGSSFFSSACKHQSLEAVWIKSSNFQHRWFASLFTILLVLSFIAHYFGLRAVTWWVATGELGVCILAAFARSISNDLQPRFKEVDGIKIDKRCASTGVIRVSSAKVVNDSKRQRPLTLDARAYSQRTLNNPPLAGERVAYEAAKLCLKEVDSRKLVLGLTGMKLHLTGSGQPGGVFALIASFSNGLLVTEGLAFPTTQVCIAFRANTTDLAAPTSLLCRSVLRQPEWKLDCDFPKGIPLGNVYIFAMQSMLTWWTLSEDRNDMGNLQSNLHWPFILVNMAFFILLMESGEKDVLVALEKAHEGNGDDDVKVAEAVVAFIRDQVKL